MRSPTDSLPVIGWTNCTVRLKGRANWALPCRLNGARTACGNCPGTRASEGAGLAPYENGQILYLTRRTSPGVGGYLSHIIVLTVRTRDQFSQVFTGLKILYP